MSPRDQQGIQVIALLAAIVLGQEVAQPPPNLASDVIFAPLVWERPPRPEYPGVAGSQGVQSGWAAVRCQVDAQRRPNHCEILAESQPDLGFGTAAAKGMEIGILRPDWAAGRDRADSFEQVVRFMLAE